jgi:hypothetical protein
VAQRIVEMLIGRLITDEEFRAEFLGDPEGTLAALSGRGLELTSTEVTGLMSTDPAVWVRAAEMLDPRLQKASLNYELMATKEGTHHV